MLRRNMWMKITPCGSNYLMLEEYDYRNDIVKPDLRNQPKSSCPAQAISGH